MNLVSNGRTAEAVEPAQAAVDLLAGFTPPPAVRTEYLATLASARHELVLRLMAAGRMDEAMPQAKKAVQAYRQAAAAADADVMWAANQLRVLSVNLVSNGRTAEAVEPA
ncbi:hypothetical protein ACFWBF_36510, partial [Streptomyces sp. NPDC060028]|uniref:hypothetical protein n=1 Tax=Streptomyces sp. NPDC060028 TaxID=3347041 RepID=UPI003675E00D